MAMQLIRSEKRQQGDYRNYRLTLDVDGRKIVKQVFIGGVRQKVARDDMWKVPEILRCLNEARRDALFEAYGENWRDHDPHNFWDGKWITDDVKQTFAAICDAHPEEFAELADGV